MRLSTRRVGPWIGERAPRGDVPCGVSRRCRIDREDEAGEAAFLQDEFLKGNVALPSALVQSVPTLAEEAQDLVIDLLCGGDDE